MKRNVFFDRLLFLFIVHKILEYNGKSNRKYSEIRQSHF